MRTPATSKPYTLRLFSTSPKKSPDDMASAIELKPLKGFSSKRSLSFTQEQTSRASPPARMSKSEPSSPTQLSPEIKTLAQQTLGSQEPNIKMELLKALLEPNPHGPLKQKLTRLQMKMNEWIAKGYLVGLARLYQNCKHEFDAWQRSKVDKHNLPQENRQNLYLFSAINALKKQNMELDILFSSLKPLSPLLKPKTSFSVENIDKKLLKRKIQEIIGNGDYQTLLQLYQQWKAAPTQLQKILYEAIQSQKILQLELKILEAILEKSRTKLAFAIRELKPNEFVLLIQLYYQWHRAQRKSHNKHLLQDLINGIELTQVRLESPPNSPPSPDRKSSPKINLWKKRLQRSNDKFYPGEYFRQYASTVLYDTYHIRHAFAFNFRKIFRNLLEKKYTTAIDTCDKLLDCFKVAEHLDKLNPGLRQRFESLTLKLRETITDPNKRRFLNLMEYFQIYRTNFLKLSKLLRYGKLMKDFSSTDNLIQLNTWVLYDFIDSLNSLNSYSSIPNFTEFLYGFNITEPNNPASYTKVIKLINFILKSSDVLIERYGALGNAIKAAALKAIIYFYSCLYSGLKSKKQADLSLIFQRKRNESFLLALANCMVAVAKLPQNIVSLPPLVPNLFEHATIKSMFPRCKNAAAILGEYLKADFAKQILQRFFKNPDSIANPEIIEQVKKLMTTEKEKLLLTNLLEIFDSARALQQKDEPSNTTANKPFA